MAPRRWAGRRAERWDVTRYGLQSGAGKLRRLWSRDQPVWSLEPAAVDEQRARDRESVPVRRLFSDVSSLRD